MTESCRGFGENLAMFGDRLVVGSRDPSPGQLHVYHNDGGQILIKRVRPEGEGKIPAGEFAAAAGLAVGDVFGGG